MQENRHILIVEDDARLAKLVRDYLAGAGFRVTVVDRGDTAVQAIESQKPDLVILDLMLPGKDGFTVCKEARNFYTGPILMLTAIEDDMDQVTGLEMGSDDYVKKPVVPRVLLARVKALLRRFGPTPADGRKEVEVSDDPIIIGSLEVRPSAREVFLEGKKVDLTTAEYDCLYLLVINPGVILDRDLMYRELRGIDYDGLDRSLDMVVSRLRKKLGDDSKSPARLKTIWGKGYLFVKHAW